MKLGSLVIFSVMSFSLLVIRRYPKTVCAISFPPLVMKRLTLCGIFLQALEAENLASRLRRSQREGGHGKGLVG